MTNMTASQHENPLPWWVMKFTLFQSFACNNYYAFSLSEQCPRKKKKILQEILHFYHMTYKCTLKHVHVRPRTSTRTPSPGVIKFTFFNTSLVIITLYIVCLKYAPKKREVFFCKIHYFNHFNPKFSLVVIFTISCLLSLQMGCCILNLIKIGPVVLQIFTHNGRRTTTAANPQQYKSRDLNLHNCK